MRVEHGRGTRRPARGSGWHFLLWGGAFAIGLFVACEQRAARSTPSPSRGRAEEEGDAREAAALVPAAAKEAAPSGERAIVLPGQEYDGVTVAPEETRAAAGATLDASVRIDAGRVVNRVSPRLFGYNWSWYQSQAFADANAPGGVDPKLIEATRGLPMPFNRMSGTGSQYFQWKQAIGPAGERPRQQLMPWKGATAAARFGPVEWITFCRRMDPRAEFCYVLNFVSDTPESAADVAEFLCAGRDENPRGGRAWAQARGECGLEEPVKVAVWELGNELDDLKAWSVETYVETCRRHIAAVREVDPRARFAAQAAGSPWNRKHHANLDAWRAWHRHVLKELHRDIDYVAFHPYYEGVSVAAMDFYIRAIRDDVAEIAGDERIRVYASEHARWPPRTEPTKARPKGSLDATQTHSLKGCLATADFLVRCSARPCVGAAAYHCFRGGPWALLRRHAGSGAFYRTGMAHVMWMLGHVSGWDAVRTDVTGERCDLDGRAREDQATFIAQAYRRAGSLAIAVVNKDPTTARMVTVSLDGGWRLQREYVLTADSLESYNVWEDRPLEPRERRHGAPRPFEGFTAAPRSLTLLMLGRERPTRVGDGWDGVTWQSLGAGAGGNIQSLALDANTPGRIFFCSDMEGLYRSDDYGQSWRYAGSDVSHSYVNCVTVEPGDARRVYCGTVGSLEVSDDGGLSYRRVPGIVDSIGQVVVDERDTARVLALPGERHRWRARKVVVGTIGPWGELDYYDSPDRGRSWRRVVVDARAGRRDVLSFDIAGGATGRMFLAAVRGIYESDDGGATWRPVAPPSGAGDCLGAALSPDGRTLYATYRVPSDGAPAIVTTSHTSGLSKKGHSHLFATRVPGATWVDLSDEKSGFRLSDRGFTLFWRPRIDPRSTGEAHRMLIGTYRPQHGVWEVTARWEGARLVDHSWKRILWYDDERTCGWDVGWERWRITGEDYHFAPPSWGRHMAFSTGGQTAYVTDLDAADYATAWRPIYTRQVRLDHGVRTYRTRGADCTYTLDGDAWGEYAVQCQADNAVLESFDGGYSWSHETKPGGWMASRGNCAEIVREVDPPLVLVDAAVGWGANVGAGGIYAKRLATCSSRDRWVPVAGGRGRDLAGLPAAEYAAIARDPRAARRVYVGTRFGDIYVVDDVVALYDAARSGRAGPRFGKLRSRPGPKPKGLSVLGGGIVFDPVDANVLWVSDRRSLWKGVRGSDGAWAWTKVIEQYGYDDIATVVVDGRTCVVARRKDEVVWSRDGGRSWEMLVTPGQIAAARRPPAWYHPGLAMAAQGFAAHGRDVYFCYVTPGKSWRRAYGMFKVTVDRGGAAKLEDVTADLHWPYPLRQRVIEVKGKSYLYLFTRGNGAWRRRLGDAAIQNP